MSIAPQVVWELHGLVPAREAVVIPFPVKVADPAGCQRRTRKLLRRMSRSPATIMATAAVLANCDACQACFTPR